MKIAPAILEEIRRLLAQRRLSQRDIARLMRVSRSTVAAIARGKRPRPEAPVVEKRPSGPPQRCPTCGGKVYMPCHLCRIRTELAKGTVPPLTNGVERPGAPLSVALVEPEATYFREVIAERQRQAAEQIAATGCQEESCDEE